MSQDELRNGQRWVEDAVVRLLAERGMKLAAPIEWTPDMDRELYLLQARMNGATKLWKLTYEALEDCPADKNVQRKIEESLRMYFIPDIGDGAGSEPAIIEVPTVPLPTKGPEQFVAPAEKAPAPPAPAKFGDADDRRFARLAIEEARKSAPEDERVHPRVGVVIVRDGRVLASAHRGEVPQCHAEFIALEKKLADTSLFGATVYTTLEPCTSRNHPKVPCATRLTERKVGRVVIGMLDPDDKISGRGQRALRKAGIATELFPHDLMAEVEELNRDFMRDRESRESEARNAFRSKIAELPSFLLVFGAPLGENDAPVWIMMLKHYGPNTAYNCDVAFFDNDRKNIEHQWLVEHPNSSFLPPGGVAGKSQMRFHVPEAGPEGSIDSFQWTPIDPNSQHYTVSISCRDGVFVENWEVTRVDGVLRTKVKIEHGPQWVEKNPTLSPLVFACTEPGFVSTPLASVLPAEKTRSVNPGWKPNHRFEFPVAIIDPNGSIQVMSGVKLPDGSQKTDFGCWNMLTKHFGDKP